MWNRLNFFCVDCLSYSVQRAALFRSIDSKLIEYYGILGKVLIPLTSFSSSNKLLLILDGLPLNTDINSFTVANVHSISSINVELRHAVVQFMYSTGRFKPNYL